jgi:hypothetical protein
MLRTFAIVTVAAVGAVSSIARADSRDRGRDDFRHEWRSDSRRYDHDRDHGSGRVDIRIGGGTFAPCPPPAPICLPPPPVCEQRVWVPAVYRTVTEQKWVEPVYRTVYDRVWIEPVTRTEYERAWVADRYEWRNIDHVANGRRYTSRECVLVEAAHWADVPHTVEITPGRYEDRPRQELVCAGHFETCAHEELVCAGHYETRPVIVAAPPPVRRYDDSHFSIGVRFPL